MADAPPGHPELATEQAYIDAAYARLDSMRVAAARVAAGFAEVGAGGTHQARLERDVADSVTRRRLAALDIGDTPLVFGRLDRTPDHAPADQRFYIGRLAVNDEEQEPLVVDWRAPVAEPFYRATAVAPMGVVRRRHFLTRPGVGRELAAIDDEVFDRDAAEAAGLSAVGEAALFAALDRARTGRMGDIVATIQAEQDEAIRADLAGVLIVSGGPGTGKTAVALHRAAYLLYTYRKRLASQGVLLVGPSPIFLRYIDQVLPSLGEDDVTLATAAGLKPQHHVRAVDAPAVAIVKGDARMAHVVQRALHDREHPLPRDVVFTLDSVILRITRGDSRRIVERASRRRGTHNERRVQVARQLIDILRAQYRRALAATAPDDDPEWDRELDNRIRRAPQVRAALERMWPVLSGADLIHDLFSFEGLIRSAATGVLTAEEQRSLFRARSANVREVAWTEADLALIDEADSLLGSPESARPRRRRNRRRSDDDAASRTVAELGVAGFMTAAQLSERYGGATGSAADDASEPRTFGHVLVDEAQDLSPMQWRMLARRCPSGSMTLVGDFGQASRAGSATDWNDVLGLVPTHAPTRHVTLSVNYRTPAEIMAVAARVLAAAAADMEAPESVRTTGVEPEFVDSGYDRLIVEVAVRARAAVRREGTKAIIAPPARHAAIVAELADIGAVSGSADALDAPIAVLGPVEAKGLEFDDVIVVEPAELVLPDRRGLRLLYVTLTRATQRLSVVHAAPLPEALAPAELAFSEPNQRGAAPVTTIENDPRATDPVAADLRAGDVAWDIEPLVDGRGEAGVDAMLDQAAELAADLTRFRDRVAELDAAELAEAVREMAALAEIMGRAGSYVGLQFAVDTANPAHGALLAKVEERTTAITNDLLFFELEWAALADEHVAPLLADEQLAFCRHYLASARRYRPHLLSEPEERILADKSVTGRSAWGRLFSELTSAITVDLDGGISLEAGLSRLQAPDREVRTTAAAAVSEALLPGLRTRAFVFNTLLADKATDDRLRAFPGWLASRNLDNEASDESVQALVDAVVSRYDIPQRWYALKAQLLGLDRIADFDRMASVAATEDEFGWSAARALVLDAYHSFSPELADVANRFFDEHWIDAPMRPGKRPGAFCAYTVPSHHPYLLLNWTARRRDVLTLAHEMGHGLHAYLARDQIVFQQSTPLTLAETASVFGETVTFGRLLAETADPDARLALLVESLEGQIATVFRQIAMNRFEDAVHTARREQGELSVDHFGELWASTQADMLGDAVEITDGYRTWWSYIPHFIGTPGYVYAYAYGQLLALSVYRQYEEHGAAFVPSYLELLRRGGSETPEALGRIVGVDLGDPAFWTGGLTIIDEQLAAAEAAARDAGRL